MFKKIKATVVANKTPIFIAGVSILVTVLAYKIQDQADFIDFLVLENEDLKELAGVI